MGRMISQKTVSKLSVLLRRLFSKDPYSRRPLWTWRNFRDELYARGVEARLLDHLEAEYDGDPNRFLPLIHDGTVHAFVYRNDGWGQPVPVQSDREMGQTLMAAMIQVVIPIAESIPDYIENHPKTLSDELIASLREDGLGFIGGKIVPTEIKAVDLRREDEYLIALIRSINPPNMDDIQYHHDEFDKAFAHGGWGSASSEARNFQVATLRGLRDVATTRGNIPAYKQPGKDGPLIEDFKAIGLFTGEERDAVMHVWVLLGHSGPHVGIKEEDSARLSGLLVIGMTEWIVLKFIQWEKNGFKPF